MKLTTTFHRLVLPGPPLGREPLRIVQISDLHRGPFVGRAFIRQVVEAVNACRPDLVALTGDFVSEDAAYADDCAASLAELEAGVGVFAVLGNHDHLCGGARVSRALESHGVSMLTNTSREVAPGFWVAGVDDWWRGRPDMERALAGVPAAVCPLLLCHNPRACVAPLGRPALALAGHTHGGQVYLPVFSRLLMTRVRTSSFVRGWYRLEGGGLLYVNRGIGTVRVPLRLGSVPEISVFDLELSTTALTPELRAWRA